MKLSQASEGKSFIVTGIEGEELALHAIRFGMDVGTAIVVAKNITGGPVIVCKNQLEIAVGREIADAIEIEPTS